MLFRLRGYNNIIVSLSMLRNILLILSDRANTWRRKALIRVFICIVVVSSIIKPGNADFDSLETWQTITEQQKKKNTRYPLAERKQFVAEDTIKVLGSKFLNNYLERRNYKGSIKEIAFL